MTATATRVPVLHGHLASLSVGLTRSADVGDVASALRDFEGDPSARDLPLAPAHALEVTAEDDRPQPRVDRDRGDGMTVSVGRIRPCAVLDVTFLVLAHNLVRGAAGAALLNAELCHARGLTKAFGPGRVATTAAGD